MRWNRTDWIAVIAVTLLAAALRFYQIGVVPPGFQFDEAFNAIDAQQVLAGNRPLFLPANAGREVVYTYWQALLVYLFGMDVRILRLASAIFGVIAIPATYVLLRLMLRRDSRRIALFTSLVLATSLWHIHFSHYGIRVIMMPVVFSFTFGAFWLGGRLPRPGARVLAYCASGLFLGLSVWTHPTGRLAPFVLLLYTAWILWHYPADRRLRLAGPLGGLLISGVVAFLVFLPLGLEFARHPEFFTGHASEVSVFAQRVSGDSPAAALTQNVLHVLGMFAVSGDLEWTHNLAGRPVFDILMALTYFGGVAILVLRLVRDAEDNAEDRDAFVFLTLWAAVLLLPSVLSEAAPNYSRTLPALPALFVPAGLGLTWIASIRRPVSYAGVGVAAAILLYSGVRSTVDYFVVFPAQQEVYYWYDADKLDALNYLATLTEDNEVYLSQLWGSYHATVSMLRRGMGIKSYDMGDTLVLPPAGMGAVYAFPSEQQDRAQQLAALWPDIEPKSIPDKFGNVLLYLVEVPAGLASQLPERYSTMQSTPAAFVRAPDLIGQYSADPDKQVTLLWDADEPVDGSLTAYVHLIDADGHRVAQIDKLPANGTYRTNEWTPGERVLDRYFPQILDLCAGGEPLRVRVGWYASQEGHAARPRADASGETALAGTVTLRILSYDPGILQPPVQLDQQVSDQLTLRGVGLAAEVPQPGSPLILDLYWRSDHEEGSSPIYSDSPVTITLVSDAAESVVWEGELAPRADWDPGEEICRRVRAKVPADLAPGAYRLQLAVGDGAGGFSHEFGLSTIDVAVSTRSFEPPPVAVPVDAETLEPGTGDRIELVGANVTPVAPSPGDTLAVELVWRAAAALSGNYKVFVHLVNEAGDIVSQSDAFPGDGYATNQWVGGEVVVDGHELPLPDDLPAGEYTVIAGLYDPVSATRLEASDAAGQRYANDGIFVTTVPVTASD